jgi:hypothetical protein
LVFSKSILRHANYGSRDQDQTPRTTLQGTLDLAGTFRSGSDQGELSRRLWAGDTFVDFEHSLAISKIREAPGDSADSPRYLETLPRRGYRFIAEATVVSGGSVNKLAPAAGDPPPAKDHDQIEVVGKTVVSKRPSLAAGFEDVRFGPRPVARDPSGLDISPREPLLGKSSAS